MYVSYSCQCRRTKRLRRLAVDKQFQIDVIVRQGKDVSTIERRIELLGDELGILRAEPERDQRGGIAKACGKLENVTQKKNNPLP